MITASLLGSLTSQQGDPAKVDLYVGVILSAGFNVETIKRTAERFMHGLVPDRNEAFPPSTAEFCTEARKVAEQVRDEMAEKYPPDVAAYLRNAAMYRDDPDMAAAWQAKAEAAMDAADQAKPETN